MNAPRITIDFESRSTCDIGLGAWLYSSHPSTVPLCLAYKIGDGMTHLWHPAIPAAGILESDPPDDLFKAIASGYYLVEAHNRFFEFCIWTNVMMRLYGWPEIPDHLWRCSAAKASYYGLPRALDGAIKAMGLPIEKDMEGNAIMRKLCKPKKPTKSERNDMLSKGLDPDVDLLWIDDRAMHERNWAYCMTDVEGEHAFSDALPDLPEMEHRIWQMDQRMNLRGVRCDLDMVRAAIRLRDREVTVLNEELNEITGGAVPTAGCRAAFVRWCNEQGTLLPDTKGATLDKWVTRRVPPLVATAIRLVREVNRTSTAKYDAMLERADPRDWRIRDTMMYHGAGTGRWTGKGVQPHNFPRGGIKDIDTACEVVRLGEALVVRALYGEVMKHLSDSLRGALTASEGHELIVADYAAIEARVVFWLARDNQALDVFRSGKDIYMDMATGVYGYPVVDKKAQAAERQFGKQGILGLGFEMGFATFLLTCKKYDISFTPEMVRTIVGDRWQEHEAAIRKYFAGDKRRVARMQEEEIDIKAHLHEFILMKHTVDTYRARYPEVTQMWRDQEAAAIAAVKAPGQRFDCERGRNHWIVEDGFLKTYLPSGRPLHYRDPKIMLKRTPWKDAEGNFVYKPALTFMGVHPMSKKWTRLDTYGGSLVENITQATARDLMAQAMVDADESGRYRVLLSVHDELVAELPSDPSWTDDDRKALVKDFERLMATAPAWAEGCPVEAEGWLGFRYRK